MPPTTTTILPDGTEERTRLAANDTLHLDDPALAWRVEQGQVLVFAVQLRKDEATGPRHLVGQFGPGELVVGHRHRAGERLGLLATGVGEAWVRRTDLEDLFLPRIEEGGSDSGELPQAIERWVCALWGRICLGRCPPASMTEVAPGALALPAGVAASPESGVVWTRLISGSASVVGAEGARLDVGSALVPIGRPGWIVADGPVEAECHATTDALGRPDAREGLAAMTSGWMAILSGDVEQADDCRGRATRLSAVRARAEERSALVDLAQVLPAARAAARRVPAVDPALAVFRAVARSAGVAVPADDPAVAAASFVQDQSARLGAMAAAVGCHLRAVDVSERWWEAESGSMIGFTEDARPVALLQRLHGYEVFDPSTGRSTRAGPATAGALSPRALSLHPRLGSEARRVMDLVRGGYRRSGLDLGRVVLFGAFAGATSLVTPLLTGLIFNDIVPNDHRGRLLIVIAVLVCVAISVAFASLARTVAFVRLQARFEGNSEISLWDRLLHLPASFFSDYLVGDLTNRAISLELVQNVMSDASMAIVLNGVFSLFNLALFAVAGFRLMVVGIGLVVVEVVVALLLTLVQARLTREQLLAQNRTQGFLLQIIRGIHKLRVAAAESQALTVWGRLFAAQQRATYRVGRVLAMGAVFTTAWMTLTTLVVVATVAAGGLRGTSIGSYLEFTTAFGQVSVALAGMFGALSAMVLIAPLLDQVRPLLETPVEAGRERESPGTLIGSVTVNHVTFRYRPESPIVLDDVSLEARPGEFVAVVGPSGAGKSSLVRLLLGFEMPEAGTVLYDHKDLSGLDPMAVRRQIGTLIQSAQLLPGTIFTNIAAGHPLTRDQAWGAAEAAGVAAEIRAMPMGMETAVVDGAATVSGGQRQRILIARALARTPRILIFDEATSALDNVTQATVTASLARLNVTRIVIAHRLSTVQEADRIFVMMRGRVEQVGTFSGLISVPGPFADLAARQLA